MRCRLTEREPSSILVEDRLRRGGSATAGSQIPDENETIEIAHSARGLDLYSGRYAGSHAAQVVFGCPLIRILAVCALDEAVAGRGLHPIGSGAFGDLTELLFQ